MPSIKNLINSHNQNVLKNQPQSTPKTCNCLKKKICPMNGLCFTESLMYYATITWETKKIISSCIKEFEKQLSENATETIKSLLTFQPTKTIPNFLLNNGSLKQSSLTRKYHGKLKGDTFPIIPFLEDVTYS